ncbi:hypothetical protein PR202_gb02238 [Eleusine coracana subsp. coracana]|uniref:Uncharacterized protein n=1 Tax=Eleusine coracana subsp. coracana TaxID=191504 RepID=A0AAV5DYN2_ELECO|nr:hypothetical protein PR202_gb02238 [Eleusine coracana subsp. coracana]
MATTGGEHRAQTLRDLAEEGKKRAVLLLVFAFGLAFLMSHLWYSRVTPDKEGPEELINVVNTALGEFSARARNVNLISLLTRDLVDLICNNLELYHFCQAKIGKEKFVNLSSERRDAELKLTLIAENKLHPALFSATAEYKVLQSLADGLISATVKPQDLQCSFFRYTARELLACAVLKPVMNLANPRFINERIESFALSRASKAEKRVTESLEDATTVKPREPPMPSVDEFSALIDPSGPGVELVPFHQGQSKTASNVHPSKSKDSSLKLKSPNSSLISSSHPLESTSLPSSSLIAMDNGFPTNHNDQQARDSYGRECAPSLGISSQQKHQALAPEHLENMWTKGKNYKSENIKHVAKVSSLGSTPSVQPSVPNNTSIRHHPSIPQRQTDLPSSEDQHLIRHSTTPTYSNGTNHLQKSLSAEVAGHASPEDFGVESESSYTTEDEESNNVTGLDSPVTRVWDSKSKGNVTSSHIHHPLESSSFHKTKKTRSHVGKLKVSRTSSGRKRPRSNAVKTPAWQEVERSSLLVGDDSDILNSSANDPRMNGIFDDTDVENMARMFSSANASSLSLASTDSSYLSNYCGANVLEDSYLKLRCEVVGASIVKSGSGMFAVYSISVTDANGNSWSIKRRFRHFEELHRRLKEYAQYNLHLPPKHFLSSGLEVPVVRERCKLLDIYLKKLLQIPIVSSCIEVWDFLSVDSQTYIFADSLSVIQTLSVGLDERSNEKDRRALRSAEALSGNLISGSSLHRQNDIPVHKDLDFAHEDGLRFRKGNAVKNSGTSISNTTAILDQDNSGSDPELNDYSLSINSGNPKKQLPSETEDTSQIWEPDGYSVAPNNWMAPNLSVPLFHLVDVVFQLQDGGWIRQVNSHTLRQAFWVAKQILQLGMGDTFDDWLVEKIQLLRKGRIIAFAVKRVEQILWPDGFFLTKHPKRQAASPPNAHGNGINNNLTDEQRLEAAHRANFVRELIIDKAPYSLVSLVGRKEYERCAQDIFFFLQSPVCLKQLAFELLELLIRAGFPELDGTVRTWHEDKQQLHTLE